MDPSAPETQSAIAEVYELLTQQTKVGDERHEYERKVLEARTALAKYIGDTPWVDANKDNPAALQRAEELVRTGLKGAAITHTRNGQSALEQADQTGDAKEKLRLTNYALQEYKLAALGWLGYLKQDENALRRLQEPLLLRGLAAQPGPPRGRPPPVRSEAVPGADVAGDRDGGAGRHRRARLRRGRPVHRQRRPLRRRPRRTSIATSRSSAGRTRADRRASSLGRSRSSRAQTGEQTVVVDEIPDVIQKSMKARDEYVQRVPPERDKQNRALEYAFYAADQYYLYGHFKEARERFEPIYKEQVRQEPPRVRGLEAPARDEQPAEGRRAVTAARRGREEAVVRDDGGGRRSRPRAVSSTPSSRTRPSKTPTRSSSRRRTAKPGPAQDALWRKAGQMYGRRWKPRRLTRTPPPPRSTRPSVTSRSATSQRRSSSTTSSSAATAARTSSTASSAAAPTPRAKRRSGRTPKSTRSASSTWGWRTTRSPRRTTGSSSTSRRRSRSPRSRTTRASTIRAARTPPTSRWRSTRTSATARTWPGCTTSLVDSKMHLPVDKRAEADYLKASFDYGQWNPSAPDSGGNSSARHQAIATLTQYHAASKDKPESARYALESAYRIAKMMQAAGDNGFRTWFKTTIADWEYFKSHPVTTSAGGKQSQIAASDAPYSDYGGEADFTLVDEDVRGAFDYATGHHHYAGERQRRGRRGRQGPRRGREEVATAARARLDAVRLVRVGRRGDGAGRHAVRLDPHGARSGRSEVLHPAAGGAPQQAAEDRPTSSRTPARTTRPTRSSSRSTTRGIRYAPSGARPKTSTWTSAIRR